MANEQSFKNDLDSFADRLLVEKGLDNLDKETLAQLKKDLVDRLDDRINAAIIEKMPQDKLNDFEKLIDQGNDVEIQQFCQQNIPDLDQVIANELINFRAIYLS